MSSAVTVGRFVANMPEVRAAPMMISAIVLHLPDGDRKIGDGACRRGGLVNMREFKQRFSVNQPVGGLPVYTAN